jgi:hypothetical protein
LNPLEIAEDATQEGNLNDTKETEIIRNRPYKDISEEKLKTPKGATRNGNLGKANDGSKGRNGTFTKSNQLSSRYS